MKTAAWNVLTFVFMMIILLAALALMASENIDGAGAWLSATGTELTANLPLMALILVAGVLAAMLEVRGR